MSADECLGSGGATYVLNTRPWWGATMRFSLSTQLRSLSGDLSTAHRGKDFFDDESREGCEDLETTGPMTGILPKCLEAVGSRTKLLPAMDILAGKTFKAVKRCKTATGRWIHIL